MARGVPVTGFERFWNSTFGIPQQILWRMIRAAQDPNVDLFDEEGLMDAALIPVFGMFDPKRHDVRESEMVRRINQLAGTNLDEDSFLAQIGAGILTDPLSALTTIPSATARSARVLSQAMKSPALAKNMAEEGVNVASMRLGRKGFDARPEQMQAALKRTLEDGTIRGRERLRLERAGRVLEGGLDGRTVAQTLERARDTEQVIGVPFFSRHVSLRVSDQYKSWFHLLGTGAGRIPGARMAAIGVGHGAMAVPGIRGAVTAMADFKAGRATAGRVFSRVVSEPDEVRDRGIDIVTAARRLGRSENTDRVFKGLTKRDLDGQAVLERMAEFQRRGLSREEAFARAVPGPHKTAEGTLRTLRFQDNLVGPVNLGEVDIAGEVDNFIQTVDDSVRTLADSMEGSARELTEAGRENIRVLAEGRGKAFRAGRKAGELWNKVFRTDAKLLDILEHEQDLRTLRAKSQESLDLTSQDGVRILRESAQAVGMDPRDYEELVMNIVEIGALDADVAARARYLEGSPSQGSRVANPLHDVALRLTTLAEDLMIRARQGKANPQLQQLADEVSRLLGPSMLTDTNVTAFFKEAARVRYKSTPDIAASITGDSVNRAFVLSAGESKLSQRLQGRHLAHISTRELAKRADELKRTATRKVSESELIEATLSDPALNRISDRYGLTAQETRRVVERARKGKLRRFITKSDGKRVRLTDDQIDEITSLAKSTDLPPKNTLDLSTLRQTERMDLDQIEKVLDLRRQGIAEVQSLPKPRTGALPNDPRVAEDLVQEIAHEAGGGVSMEDLGPLGESIARLFHSAAELRSKTLSGVVTPALIEDVTRASRSALAVMEDAMRGVFGPEGSRFLDWAKTRQHAILRESLENGIVGIGSPLGYIGHILSGESRRTMQALLGEEDVGRVLNQALPQLSSSFVRNVDSMTITEFNKFFNAVQRSKDPTVQRFIEPLQEIVEKHPDLKLGQFTESPFEALMVRLGQSVERATTKEYLDDVFLHLEDLGIGFAGRVEEVITDAGRRVPVEGAARKTARNVDFDPDDTLRTISVEDEVVEEGLSALVMRTDSGRLLTIPKSQFGDSFVALDLDDARRIPGEPHEATTAAAVRKVSRGDFKKEDLLGLRRVEDSDLAKLAGRRVLVGNEMAISGPLNALQKQFDQAGDMLSTFDAITYTIKKWQTVFRPAFHILNVGSAAFQARSLGISPRNILAGQLDAMRFLQRNKKAARAYSDLIAGVADDVGFVEKRGGFLPSNEFVRTIRRAGLDDLPEADLEQLRRMGLEPEDLAFTAGGHTYDIAELMQAMGDGGLFATFVSEGLRGSSRVSERLMRARAAALDGSKAGPVLRRLRDGLGNATESSEIYARTSILFAQLREGIPLRQAVENTKLATVDYAQTTAFERNVLKRFITYYTFPRHYLPQAFKHYAQRPDAAARASALMRSEGLVREENGQVRLDVGKLGSLDLSRLDPNLESLKLIESLGEVMTEGGGLRAGSEVARQERVSGRGTPHPFELGGLSLPIAAALGRTENDKGALAEAADLFWFTRFYFDEGDPLGETTPLQKMVSSALVPFKQRRPKMERTIIAGRLNRAVRELERKAQIAQDPRMTRSLREQAQRLVRIARAQLEEVPR